MKASISSFVAMIALLLSAYRADAAVVKSASGGSTSVHPTITTTTGQKQILLAIDPISITDFNLQVQFDADKVSFQNIQGVNGYAVDFFEIQYSGNVGFVTNIIGHYVSSTYVDPTQTTPPILAETDVVPNNAPIIPNLPPPGEVILFNISFVDPMLGRTEGFVIGPGPNGYLNGIDPDTGATFHLNANQIDPVDVQVAGVSPSGVPIPPALGAGALGGFLMLVRRRFM